MELTDAEVYEKHADELMRFATGLVGPNDAADILSTAVINAISSPKWAAVGNKRAYLFRAVMNAAASTGRSNKRRQLREERVAHRDAGSTVVLLPTNLHPEVLDAVANLSVQQRAVIFLTYWNDLTVPTIASLLDLTEGSVKRHLARARANLRKTLQ